jgi:citronellol/citronellal dehydrogenase
MGADVTDVQVRLTAMRAASSIFVPGVLDGHVALITGGGTGLGKAAARELLACGANVLICGRRAEVLEAACAELGEGCDWVAGDVRDTGECERIVDVALDRFGRLDTLVNNAGGQYFVPAEAIGLRGFQAVTRLNVGATLGMARVAYERALRPAGGGMVVNVTLSPHHGLPGMTHSSVARATVEGLTRELAASWAPDGVAVCAVAAGHFETEAIQKYPAPVKAGAARSVPLGRLGRPEEHGWLIALLATPLGRRFSGSVITLDGARDNWFGPWPPPTLTDETGAVPTEERRPSR